MGARAADEALVALRLALAGLPASDDNVRRLRGLAAVARAAASGDRAALDAALARDRAALADLTALDDLEAAGARAREGYAEALAAEPR